MATPLSTDINIPPIYSSVFNNIMTFSINNHNLYRASHKKYDGVSHYFCVLILFFSLYTTSYHCIKNKKRL